MYIYRKTLVIKEKLKYAQKRILHSKNVKSNFTIPIFSFFIIHKMIANITDGLNLEKTRRMKHTDLCNPGIPVSKSSSSSSSLDESFFLQIKPTEAS